MSRVRRRAARVLLAAALIAGPSHSYAQSFAEGPQQSVLADVIAPVVRPAAAVGTDEAGPPAGLVSLPRPSRPRSLPALYVTFGALQALDAVTTFRALDRGAAEVNPVLGGIASNRGAMLALKAASLTSTVYLTERLWKRNRTAAVAMMVCVNSAYAVIVAHNYRVGSRAR